MSSHISRNYVLTNFPPLSVKNFLGAPKIWIQLPNIALMIKLALWMGQELMLIILVAWLTRWRRIFLLGNFISNHQEKIENVTHTAQIFFKLSPVDGIIKTRQSWKFELVTPSCFQSIALLRFHVCRKRLWNCDIRKWCFLCRK